MYNYKTSDCRFAEIEEIQHELVRVDLVNEKCKFGGLVVHDDKNSGSLDVYNSENHTLIVGGTGSMKTRGIIAPSMISMICAGENIIVNDVKGELYRMMSSLLQRKGYEICVINFRNPMRGDQYNPLEAAYVKYQLGDESGALSLILEFATPLFREVDSSNDPYWALASINYFCGLAMLLIEISENSKQCTLNNIYNLHMKGYKALSSYYAITGKDTKAYSLLCTIINLPNDTRESVFGVFSSVMTRFVFNDEISDMLSESTFFAEDFIENKVALFLINRDETAAYNLIESGIITQLYCLLIEMAESKGGKLPRITNIVLDEFQALCLREIDSWVSASRSRGIRLYFAVQSFKQLDYAYGRESKMGEIIIDNCSNIVYLYSPSQSTIEMISKWCGEYFDSGKNRNTRLVSENMLKHLEKKEGHVEVLYVRLSRYHPFFSTLYDISYFLNDKEVEIPKRKEFSFEILDFDKIFSKALDDYLGAKRTEKEKEENIKETPEEKLRKRKEMIKWVDSKIKELEDQIDNDLEKQGETKEVKEDIDDSELPFD